jgi:hypothetical protein
VVGRAFFILALNAFLGLNGLCGTLRHTVNSVGFGGRSAGMVNVLHCWRRRQSTNMIIVRPYHWHLFCTPFGCSTLMVCPIMTFIHTTLLIFLY